MSAPTPDPQMMLLETESEGSEQAFLEQATADGVVFPPSYLESDEPPLESDLHRDQIDLLIRLLRWFWRDR